VKKKKLSKKTKNLEKKLKELAKVSKSRPTLINSSESYQFHTPHKETSNKVEKKQEHIRWVLINREGQLVGRLDYNPQNTRESARKWFYDTRRMFNKDDNFDERFRVVTNEEFEESKKNKNERLRFVSRNASIYKDSPANSKSSKDTKKKNESFLEFLGRAPISFGGDDE
jgi:hypothetical protein